MLANQDRADRGRDILEIYARLFGDPYAPSANLTDVLTDLMHTAAIRHELGLDFQASLEMATIHFEAESKEQLDA